MTGSEEAKGSSFHKCGSGAPCRTSLYSAPDRGRKRALEMSAFTGLFAPRCGLLHQADRRGVTVERTRTTPLPPGEGGRQQKWRRVDPPGRGFATRRTITSPVPIKRQPRPKAPASTPVSPPANRSQTSKPPRSAGVRSRARRHARLGGQALPAPRAPRRSIGWPWF